MDSWFDKAFEVMEPRKVMVEPSGYDSFLPEEQGHIMDALNETIMTIMPLIYFKPSSWAQKIDDTVNLSFQLWSRGKQVFTTVRGSGGGKTKAITEDRRELLKKDNILVLMITFNSISSASVEKDDWPSV